MAIACHDWRQAPTDILAGLYAEEVGRWSVALGWDTLAQWNHIEVGRRLGTVPGLLAFDSTGVLAGWTFFLLHDNTLQIGGLVASSEEATVALLDGIFASEAAARARAVTVFAFSQAPGLPGALACRGLTVKSYDYLVKRLKGGAPPGSSVPHESGPTTSLDRRDRLDAAGGGAECVRLRRWRRADAAAMAALMTSAYPGADETRPFAPRGTSDEWRAYVAQLVNASGCGTLMPAASFVLPLDADRLAGAVLATRLSAATAHIAQLAVDPCARQRGLGRRLVDAACSAALLAGCDRMTLLVEGNNRPARRLYEAVGFAGVTCFTSAGGRQGS